MVDIQFPQAFEQRMKTQLSSWSDFVSAHTASPPVSVRFNNRKQRSLSTLAPVPWTTDGFYLRERPSFTLDPAFHAGSYYVQEASSMLLEQAVSQVADVHESLRVLDLCAAPGGKSTHLLNMLSSDSLLISNEVIRSRATILAENVVKWGRSNIVVSSNDPEDFQRLAGYFDVIVVDAPCSGEGLFRKDADAMREWSDQNAHLCSTRQQRILHDVWPAVRENGVVIYCTCTYNPEENDENIQRMASSLNADVVAFSLDTAWGVVPLKHGYQCYPHQVKGEGFYIAVLRKKAAQSAVRIRPSRKIFGKPGKIKTPYPEWLVAEDPGFVQFNELLLTAPASLLAEIEFVCSQLKVVSAGITVGAIKHDKVIPDHAVAMSVDLADNLPTLDVDREEALAYLRKDLLWRKGLQKGFTIVNYQGLSLGWVNILDNRLNNLYPSEWRVRMRGDV